MNSFRRKKNNSNIRVTITMDSSTRKEIEKIADETGFSFSAIASSMLDREVGLQKFMRMGGKVILEQNGSKKQLRPYANNDFFSLDE